MMKNIAFLSIAAAMLVMSGCSSTKEPAIDALKNIEAAPMCKTPPASTEKTAATDTGAVIAPITNANASDANGAGANGAEAGLASILFDYDKFDIRSDMQNTLKKNGALLKGKTVKLEGNCDEFGSDEYNVALGLKRANAVKAALVNDGMNPDSISMTSLGEGNPVCLEKTQECWAKNRRVDFKLP